MTLRFVACTVALVVAASGWSYGPESVRQWALNAPNCAGLQQSPITIPSTAVSEEPTPTFTKIVRVTGDTAFIAGSWSVSAGDPTFEPTSLVRAFIGGGVAGSNTELHLKRIRVHAPGLHRTEGGQPWALEAEYTFSSDSGEDVAYFVPYRLDDGANPSAPGVASDGSLLADLQSSIATIQTGAFARVESLRLDSGFLQGHAFSYLGSYVAPPCTEGRRSLVAEVPHLVSQAQRDAIVALVNRFNTHGGGNARPTQNLNGRRVSRVFLYTSQPQRAFDFAMSVQNDLDDGGAYHADTTNDVNTRLLHAIIALAVMSSFMLLVNIGLAMARYGAITVPAWIGGLPTPATTWTNPPPKNPAGLEEEEEEGEEYEEAEEAEAEAEEEEGEVTEASSPSD